MKYLIFFLSLASVITCNGQKSDTTKGSIPKTTELKVGKANLKVSYYAPAVRGRIIYGGVVPYDQVWVTGAHYATSIEFDVPVIIGGKRIEPGKYAFFTIPGKEKWTAIINKNWDQHLTDDYTDSLDIVRLEVTPTPANHRERLMYHLDKASDKEARLIFHWEKALISIPIKLD